jgi:hypothetical protein
LRIADSLRTVRPLALDRLGSAPTGIGKSRHRRLVRRAPMGDDCIYRPSGHVLVRVAGDTFASLVSTAVYILANSLSDVHRSGGCISSATVRSVFLGMSSLPCTLWFALSNRSSCQRRIRRAACDTAVSRPNFADPLASWDSKGCGPHDLEGAS